MSVSRLSVSVLNFKMPFLRYEAITFPKTLFILMKKKNEQYFPLGIHQITVYQLKKTMDTVRITGMFLQLALRLSLYLR